MFTCRQKLNFILHIFLEILERYYNLVISGTFDMPGYTHSKSYYQLVENFRVYLQAQNQLHSPRFPRDVAKICKLLILATLDMPDYAHL